MYRILIMKKNNYIFEKYFRLMSLSIHCLFTIKTATKSISDNYGRKLVNKDYMKIHYYESIRIIQ